MIVNPNKIIYQMNSLMNLIIIINILLIFFIKKQMKIKMKIRIIGKIGLIKSLFR